MPAEARAANGDEKPKRIPDYVRAHMVAVQKALKRCTEEGVPQVTGLLKGGWVSPGPAEFSLPTKVESQKLRVRGWVPEHFCGPDAMVPPCPRCEDNAHVKIKNWTARRVVDSHDCYWLFGKAYECASCRQLKRRMGFRSWNANVLKLMDPAIINRLDILITSRVALSGDLAKSILALGKKGNSFESLRDWLSTAHNERCTEREILYRNDIKLWNRQGASEFRGRLRPEVWGAFGDLNGYNGYVPGTKYLIETFLRLTGNRAECVRRHMQMVDADTIAGDGHLKAPKLIQLAGGVRIKKMVYTIMNPFGQVPGAYFADKETDIIPSLQQMAARFASRGESGPYFAWGDSCCGGDRAMFEQSYPSLRTYRPAQLAVQQRSGGTASLQNLGFNGAVRVVKSEAEAVVVASEYIQSGGDYIIGLDCEQNATQSTNPRGRGKGFSWVDTLQLARVHETTKVVEAVDVFQLGALKDRNGDLPSILGTLLRSPSKKFTGVNIANDFTRLMQHYPSLEIPAMRTDATKSDCQNTYAANHLANEVNPVAFPKKNSANMDTLILEYLGVKKPHESQRTSELWSQETLQKEQIIYAAADALLSAKLYIAMKARHPDVSGEVAVGDAVDLIDSGNTITVAHGFVVASLPTDGVIAQSARTLRVEIQSSDVLVPGTIVHEGQSRSSHGWLAQALRTFESMFSADATSQVVEWPAGLVKKRAVDSTVDTTSDAMDDGAESESDARIAMSADEAASHWKDDSNFPIQTTMLDGYHGIDRIGDRIPRPNTLREKFISRLRDVLYIICPEDVDEQIAKLRTQGCSEEAIRARYAALYSWFVRRCRRKMPGPQELLLAFDRLVVLFTPTNEEPDRGWCTETKTHFMKLPLVQKEIVSLRKHIAKGCLCDQIGGQYCHYAFLPSFISSFLPISMDSNSGW